MRPFKPVQLVSIFNFLVAIAALTICLQWLTQSPTITKSEKELPRLPVESAYHPAKDARFDGVDQTRLQEPNFYQRTGPSSYDQVAALLTGKAELGPKNIDAQDWTNYVKLIQVNWEQYQQSIGQPMMVWSATEIKDQHPTVFYPFSGPDFTTLYQMYPDKDYYVMAALQRAERLVDLNQLSPKVSAQTLEVLGSAWNSFGQYGYFITEYLYKYLSQNNVKIGATTLMSSFLQLHQFSIQKIVPIQIADNGSIIELHEDQNWDSVRFYLVKDGREVKLDYLKMDLSNAGILKTPKNNLFLKQATTNPVLLKASSHLPQHPNFTKVRDTILENAPVIVQDETGIDYAPLNMRFDTTLYGEFNKAYRVFSGYNKDLAKAYITRDDEKILPFRIGYFKDGNYALIVARRK